MIPCYDIPACPVPENKKRSKSSYEMNVIKINESEVSKVISEAIRVIRKGGIVAFPTETFYGLGVRYDDTYALKNLYELKQRPAEKAMPLIIGGADVLPLVARSVNALAENIMAKFWPGPLTILFPARENLSEYITAGTGKVAVRIPGSSFSLDLARSLQTPVTATSANISGQPPACSPGEIIEYFDTGIDLLVDGGMTRGGLPSTIVDISEKEISILRPGAVSSEEILRSVRHLKQGLV